MGGSKKKSSSQSTQTNSWSEPDEMGLRNALVKSATDGFAESGGGMNDADSFFRSLMQPDKINPYFEKYANSVRDMSSLKTNADLAKQRSNYRLRPSAAGNFAMDETVANNNTQRDSSLYNALMNQFNTQQSQGLDAGRLLSGNDATRQLQATNILDLLKDVQTNTSSTEKTGSNGAIASAIAAYFTGGLSLAATAGAGAAAAG
jgi:hypothetical protein